MYRYRITFTADTDEQTHLESHSPVAVGDVVQSSLGYHHLVFRIDDALGQEPVLWLAKSGQGPQDAIDQAWPEQRLEALGTETPASWQATKPPEQR